MVNESLQNVLSVLREEFPADKFLKKLVAVVDKYKSLSEKE